MLISLGGGIQGLNQWAIKEYSEVAVSGIFPPSLAPPHLVLNEAGSG